MSYKPSIYLAGPFRENPGYWTSVSARIAAELTVDGYRVLCPHVMCYRVAKNAQYSYGEYGPQDERWLEITEEWIRFCDGIAYFGDIESSEGTVREIIKGKEHNINAYPVDMLPEAEVFWEWDRKKKHQGYEIDLPDVDL